VWRVIGVSGLRGQDIANKVLPGLGLFVAVLVALGGLVFNIGNIGGAALGLNALFGMDAQVGAVVSGIIGVAIFLAKDAGSAMDRFTKILGGLMIAMVAYVGLTTNPPVGEAIVRSVAPENVNALFFPIVTLLGGTVGGYITFSGAHRLIDAGITGKEYLSRITTSAVQGVSISAIMRVFLFFAVLGVVSGGITLDRANPVADAFRHGAGQIGFRLFGLILWSAAITSVVGAAYTSVSFLKTLHPVIKTYEKYFIIAFIALSTMIMSTIGRPVNLLVVAGSLNGLILPVTLGTMLLASRRKDIVGDYRHPTWMIVLGVAIVIAAGYMGVLGLRSIIALLS